MSDSSNRQAQLYSESIFRYPLSWRIAVFTLMGGQIALYIAASVFLGILSANGAVGGGVFLELAGWAFVIGGIGFSIWAFRWAYIFTRPIRVTDDEICSRTLRGWICIPWQEMTDIEQTIFFRHGDLSTSVRHIYSFTQVHDSL